MIEKMKMVCVVSSVSRKDEMLDGLRSLGLLHLAEKKSPDRAVAERFTTLPSGARLPRSTASPPVVLYGLSIGRITSGFRFTQSLIFSPTVFPVTVMHSV